MVIWKYELCIKDTQQVEMPYMAEILSVDNQDGNLCLWAIGDPAMGMASRTIEIIGTGNFFVDKLPIIRKFIGTVIIKPFVWHVFERR